MIDIEYDRDDIRLTARGHAGGAEKGSDIICAGVSALLYTLAQAADDIGGSVSLNDGDADISAGKFTEDRMIASYLFDTIYAGLEMIAYKYPDNVKVTVRDR